MSYYKKVLLNGTYVDVRLYDTITCITNSSAANVLPGLAAVNTGYISNFDKGFINEKPKATRYTYSNTDISEYCIATSSSHYSGQNITIPNWCNKVSVILVGKGGNGASGGSSYPTFQQNNQNNKNYNFYSQNINQNYNVWAPGYTGGAGGGGAFTFITNLPATPSSNISLAMDEGSTRITHNGVNYFAGSGGNGWYSTAGAASTSKSTGDFVANGQGTTSGMYTYSSSLAGYGAGGGGGWGGSGGVYYEPGDRTIGGQGGGGGGGGFCRIYYLVE
jgi:hypothetical protein